MNPELNATPIRISSLATPGAHETLRRRSEQLNAFRYACQSIVNKHPRIQQATLYTVTHVMVSVDVLNMIVAAHRGQLTAFPSEALHPRACPLETFPEADARNGRGIYNNPAVDYSRPDWTILRREH